ncbi:MAG TPA: hypothetical protein VKA89_08555 [Solirubrobacterales bacterium]|nr:hypothetical protein [Solirubrobacterales bacterium]
MISRGIPLTAHSAIEVLAAPLLMAAPFLLGFGGSAGLACFALGALLVGIAVSTAADERSIPLRTHASLDYALATLTVGIGLVVGIASGEEIATAFMVGFGAAHLALAASTRYSVRGA